MPTDAPLRRKRPGALPAGFAGVRGKQHFALLFATAFSLLVLAGAAAAQRFEAQVDRREMALNETLTLDVVYAERASTSAIDFESLLPDFSILGIRPASQTRFINLQRTSQTSWQLSLMPKRVGRLQIPAFSIGSARTQPIEIVVTPAPQGPEEGAAFSADLSVDRERAFVGEQILIRISLTTAPGVGDLRGAPLELPGTDVRLVNQSEFQRLVGDSPYQVTELTYAVFPKTPGPLSIESLQYTGSMRRNQRVVARTQPMTLEIVDPTADPEASRERPWLPAHAVALASEWSSDVDALSVGEPVTRTIQIATAGQRAAAIAPMELPDGAFKQYAEQPILEDIETSTGILGRRTDSIVIVPTEVGEITLPAIEVDWWNIDENRWQIARLPAESLQVGAASPSAAASTTPPSAAPLATPTPSGGAEPMPNSVPETPPVSPFLDRLTLGLALLCVFLLVVCIALWIRVRRLEAASIGRDGMRDASDLARAMKEKEAFHRMQRTLTKGNPLDARRAILAWAGLHWTQDRITRLEQIAERSTDPELKASLADLDAQLYRDTTNSSQERSAAIDYDALKRRLETLREASNTELPRSTGALDALYPGQTASPG